MKEIKKNVQSEMDKIVEKMTEHICDTICGKIKGLGEEEAADICCDCELGTYICNVLNEYNRINDLNNTGGMEGHSLGETDGCSRGKRKE